MSESNLTYSEIVYYFADKLISQRASFVNIYTHPSGQKFPVKNLAEVLVTAALTYLSEKGYISINVENTKKLFFIPAKKITVQKLKDGNGLGGIEPILLKNFTRMDDLKNAVYFLLNEDESSPWGAIVNIVRDSLVIKNYLLIKEKKGIFSKIKQYFINEEKTDGLEAGLVKFKSALDQFNQDKEKISLIATAVKRGISLRQEIDNSAD